MSVFAHCKLLRIVFFSFKVCSKSAVGISETSRVPDYRFSASSSYDQRYRPYKARFGANYGWTPSDRTNSWLQIDLGGAHRICAIATKGSGTNYEWATEYKVNLTLDNVIWQLYRQGGQNEVSKISTQKLQKLTKDSLNLFS